ncbi:nuclease-related domain-containing protein [Massilia litorea]|uniref:NERD domain-containing protein n=1 Tax=Massilia litorea TaxID=2769491 RepID=A0A7L9U586_9BURK|nr:nuclease-related domain-containing protein [Massilia litorea]QOL49452.1 NERD domain-containing protein [Massilia litorea]
MIYKDSDNKMPVVAILQRMLALASPDKKPLLERELRMMRAGMLAEREAVGLIDIYLKDSTRTAVVHDLRLVSNDGRAAQIDHLLIHRSRRFYLLDTRYFSQGLKITEDGDFLRWDEPNKCYVPMPSPLAAQARQVSVLRDALEPFGLDDAPVDTLVLLAPNARIERPRRFDSARVIKADQFMERLNNGMDNAPALATLGNLHRTRMSASIGDIALKLVALHRPSTADTLARFGLQRAFPPQPAPSVPLAHNAAVGSTE